MLLVNEELEWIFQEVLQFVRESSHGSTVDDAVIGRPAHGHHRPNAVRAIVVILVA